MVSLGALSGRAAPASLSLIFGTNGEICAWDSAIMMQAFTWKALWVCLAVPSRTLIELYLFIFTIAVIANSIDNTVALCYAIELARICFNGVIFCGFTCHAFAFATSCSWVSCASVVSVCLLLGRVRTESLIAHSTLAFVHQLAFHTYASILHDISFELALTLLLWCIGNKEKCY